MRTYGGRRSLLLGKQFLRPTGRRVDHQQQRPRGRVRGPRPSICDCRCQTHLRHRDSGCSILLGDNFYDQLGDSTTWLRVSPVPVHGGLSFVSVTGGYYHTCAVATGGAGYCWGLNSYGQLGAGSSNFTETTPVAIAGGLIFASVSAGGGHTCALTTARVAYCWGVNTGSNVPVKVAYQP